MGDIPSTAPIGRLYKYDIAKEGEMFYFAISRYTINIISSFV